MFGFRKHDEPKAPQYDAEKLVPALRCSICTGEQTAGFREKESGRFIDVMLIRDEKDLQEFRRQYGVQGELDKIY